MTATLDDDLSLIDRLCDALWLEDGLSRNTIDAYRRDLAMLARWLHEQLVARGCPAAEPESHSWGWYIEMPNAEFRLTLYCGTRVALPSPDSPPPPAAEVIWSCFVMVDLPFRWRFWQPGPDAMPAAHALFADVLGLVRSLPDVQDLDIG